MNRTSIRYSQGSMPLALTVSTREYTKALSSAPLTLSQNNQFFLFANTPKGAVSSAVMFILIQTAIETVLDPYRYLTWLRKTSKDADLSQEDMIHTLLPWNAPTECRTK